MEYLWHEFVKKGLIGTESMMVIPAGKCRAEIANDYLVVSQRWKTSVYGLLTISQS